MSDSLFKMYHVCYVLSIEIKSLIIIISIIIIMPKGQISAMQAIWLIPIWLCFERAGQM
jgi:hypothetical protein